MPQVLVRAALAAAAIVTTVPALSHAAVIERTTLRAADAVPRALCHARPLPGASGVATRRVEVPAEGLLTVSLSGTRFSDWDLAVFGPVGERLGASTSFGAAERALARVDAGDLVTVQACRRFGPEADVPLAVDLHAVPRSTGGDAQLVQVPISGRPALERLELTGLDVTHDLSLPAGPLQPGYAKIVVYSAAERALLERAGFPATTVVSDLRALDLAQRRQELAAADAGLVSDLPSGRDSYRQPQDYTSELKALAEENPQIVRKLTLPLATLEGRPIEGVEIATEVNRDDDGRPVYIQMGVHHAREWPPASSRWSSRSTWSRASRPAIRA